MSIIIFRIIKVPNAIFFYVPGYNIWNNYATWCLLISHGMMVWSQGNKF